MVIKRKEFLQVSSLATASLMMPRFLKALSTKTNGSRRSKVLVVIQLSGGNDGLNTIIPVTNDIYYRARPRLGISKDKALRLNDEAGINPALTAFKALYDDGSLAVINGVGYPNPDRSHFRSMDIWHSASDSKDYVNDGWLGRYLDAQCKGCDKPTQALEIDDMLSLALKGKEYSGIAFRDPKRLYNSSNEKFFREISDAHHTTEPAIDYLYKTMSETISSAAYIYKESQVKPTSYAYPETELGKNLKTISSLIQSDLNTSVYYVSLGSFDTHVNQDAQQKRLFTELNNAVESFTNDLKKNGLFNDVLIMTFSEFGRRVSQNASNGTDHGTANNMFFIGGALKQKGLINEMPDLSDLSDGDLRHQVDFKSVYATVLNKWLNTDDRQVLLQQFPYLSFI